MPADPIRASLGLKAQIQRSPAFAPWVRLIPHMVDTPHTTAALLATTIPRREEGAEFDENPGGSHGINAVTQKQPVPREAEQDTHMHFLSRRNAAVKGAGATGDPNGVSWDCWRHCRVPGSEVVIFGWVGYFAMLHLKSLICEMDSDFSVYEVLSGMDYEE
ncbi:Kinesin-Like Protein Kif18A [Manis pentadactyla]|nr:Kinesin-Like Protein Kif18A [Manis pentadactyla]